MHVKEGYHCHRWIYSEMDQWQLCGVKSLEREFSGINKGEADIAEFSRVQILMTAD